MKDIVITVKRQKTELTLLLLCFIVAFALNVYAIIAYGGQWKELFMSMGFVTLATSILYASCVVVRVVFCAIKKIIEKLK